MIYAHKGTVDPVIFEPVHDCDRVVEGHDGQREFNGVLSVLTRQDMHAIPAPAPLELIGAAGVRGGALVKAMPAGWVLHVACRSGEMWITIRGPRGETASFAAETPTVRGEVLSRLLGACIA